MFKKRPNIPGLKTRHQLLIKSRKTLKILYGQYLQGGQEKLSDLEADLCDRLFDAVFIPKIIKLV